MIDIKVDSSTSKRNALGKPNAFLMCLLKYDFLKKISHKFVYIKKNH